MAARRSGRAAPAKSGRGAKASGGGAAPGARLLHLDTFSGIAGNMFLAALLDAGLPRRELAAELAGLGVAHRLRLRRVQRGALSARYLEVLAPARKRRRSYAEIARQIGRARIRPAARERAAAMFEALARAEARVHGTALETVHFHEVGAVDAIVDVTGAALAIELLQVAQVTAAPPALGHGEVQTDHGTLPLPSPATLELLRGLPCTPAAVDWETVTPTGAAILRTLVDEFRPLPAMTIEAIGHGAGDDRPGPLPNVLRAVLGRAELLRHERVVCIEANLDDFAPEHFEYVMERLFECGALDVTLQHLQMKKSRPGFLLRVLAAPDRRAALAAQVLEETTTLGVRIAELDRLTLPRELRRVQTRFGRIAVKVTPRSGGGFDVSAEYEDCRRAARRAGVPLRDVVRAAESAGRAALERR